LGCKELGILPLEENALGEKSIFADYSDTNVRLLSLANSLNDRLAVRRIADNSVVHRELREALNKHLQCDNQPQLLEIRDNYEIFRALKNSSRYDRILLSFDWKLTYKLLNYERLMYLKLGIDGESVMRAGVKEGREVGRILDYVMMLKLNLGLDFEKKYFEKNLGEILDAIEHKT